MLLPFGLPRLPRVPASISSVSMALKPFGDEAMLDDNTKIENGVRGPHAKLHANVLPNVSCTKTSLGCLQTSQGVKIINKKKKIDKVITIYIIE